MVILQRLTGEKCRLWRKKTGQSRGLDDRSDARGVTRKRITSYGSFCARTEFLGRRRGEPGWRLWKRTMVGTREQGSRGKERLSGCVEAGHARAPARSLRFGSGEDAGDLAQLSARGADDGGGFVEALAGLAGSEWEARLRIGAARMAESLAGTGESVAFAVDEALDLEGHFDIAAAVEALAGAALAGLELGELRLPEAKDVGFDLADASDVANFEIETVWDRGLFVDALGGKLRGHKTLEGREAPLAAV